MNLLSQRVLDSIRRAELLRPGERVGVAVSGGIDSVALLRLLLELRAELGIVLSVVHFNHKLRGAESDADQEFVSSLARVHGLEFYCDSGDAAELAAEEHSGVEAAARELRYGFFHRLLGVEDEFTSAAESEAPAKGISENATPAKSEPQGLKPESISKIGGTAEAVPLPNLTQAVAFPERTEAVPFPEPTEAVTFPSVPLSASEAPSGSPLPMSVLDKIATGHTADDQAETILMRMIRGTGPRGLGGIYARMIVEDEEGEEQGEIVRPLLGIRRGELEEYLRNLKQPWREDATNADPRFTRNRVRKLLMPLLEREFNPAVVENFSELAEIARDEEDYWDNEISGWLGTVVQWSPPDWLRELTEPRDSQTFVQILPLPAKKQDAELRKAELVERIEQAGHAVANASLSRPWLLTEPKAVQRRVIKAIGEQAGIPLEFKHVEEILRFAAENGPAGKELALPGGWKIVREPESMVFVTPDLRHQEVFRDYEYSMNVPGRVVVPELGVAIEALRIALHSGEAEYNPQQLLDATQLPERLTVRNWRPGDRYWPAHTKSPKKVKELLQEKHIAQPARSLWPVATSGDEIVWMRGFPVPARLVWKREGEAVLIRAVPWNEQDAI